MKQTLITTLLLAASAVASADTLNTATFTRGGSAVGDVTINNSADSVLTLSLTQISIAGGGSNDSASFRATGDTLTPNINVGNGDNKSWTLSFTLTNSGSSTITIDSILVSAFGSNSSNNPQNWANGQDITSTDAHVLDGTYVGQEGDSQNKPVDFTVTDAGTKAINMGMCSYGSESSVSFNTPVSTRTATFTLTTPWVLEAGESKVFTVSAANSTIYSSQNIGTYAGINQLAFTGSVSVSVPEPATATLSLLALAGLAARRRRK